MVEFVYFLLECTSGAVIDLVFTDESYCRLLRSLLLHLCRVFGALSNSLVC